MTATAPNPNDSNKRARTSPTNKVTTSVTPSAAAKTTITEQLESLHHTISPLVVHYSTQLTTDWHILQTRAATVTRLQNEQTVPRSTRLKFSL